MATPDAATSALSELTPQPAPNPDAQTTVNDFLDYTEFFPSDLIRSLRLIGNLDSNYVDATQAVHELTLKFQTLPDLPANERPDPVVLRKQIATTLDKAIYCRQSTYAEASRLYEVAERHCQRLAIINRKLQALPQPPSRDPTPAPVSPQATRSINRGYDRTPRLQLHFDASRHGASSTARPRDRSRKSAVPIRRAKSGVHSASASDVSDVESDTGSTIHLAIGQKLKQPKDKSDKGMGSSRPRAAGTAGTNVHSSIAGISTSNALARLSPPPSDVRPGSRHAPWFQLTEYEMAVLRKTMKKNAVWTPSDTMIRRELDRKGRGHEYFEKEKERCKATGEEMLNEEPDAPFLRRSAVLPASNDTPSIVSPAATALTPTPAPASALAPAPAPAPASITATATATGPLPLPVSVPASAPTLAPAPPPTDADFTPIEPPRDSLREETATFNKGMKLNEAKEAKKVKRESQRQQAMRDTQELEDATRKIREAADSLKEFRLSFGSEHVIPPTTQKGRSIARAATKRKRDASPPVANNTQSANSREPSLASQDSGINPPEPKRRRYPPLQLIAPAPTSFQPIAPAPPTGSTSQASTPVVPSPVVTTLGPLSATSKTTTVQVPLAPAGPSTPIAGVKLPSRAPTRHATPAIASPTESPKPLAAATFEESEELQQTTKPAPAPTQLAATAASSRPRRESVAPKAASPPPAPVQPAKAPRAPTPAPQPAPPSIITVTRPRSARGHVPTPKAQSEEPKPNDASKPTRELRRHSIFSQSAIAAPTRMSTRKKPPPKGDITAGEDGQKTVTNVKRAQGSKGKKRKKADEDHTTSEDVDPDEPKYCFCDDVSFGQMISCDNNCEKEWFHLDCVNMTEKDIPSRRAKWYCPDCRQQLGTDAYGNPIVPPPLPGRRGNR
ncbi:hypothetical protein BDV95DRAFT_632226 [Massariosphaeria phaeospora]|uniref:PHD-type domain-containing protein n=1 Tax=Massariosphaeria phaeospora TaxID=100035 RepID=A0A7C8I6F0_9PLEO|nr:hypothetical protein BDV95DRAFT_632226 [Massariosphaeria phaeospora]